MRILSVGILGGLAASVGLAGAASATESVSLIWEATGTNWIVDPPTSTDLFLFVIINGDANGTLGGEISVDYTQGGTVNQLTFVGSTSDPDGLFGLDLLPTVDNGTSVTGLGEIDSVKACVDTSCVLATIVFHQEIAFSNVTLQSFYSVGEAVDDLPAEDFPVGFGTAQLIVTGGDDCIIDKKCSVGGSEPQDSCTAQPGEEVTYTYDFIAGCGLVIDDKLGVIGEWNGQTLSRTTTLTETTTNRASFETTECVCINSTFDSVTVTVESPCAGSNPVTTINTIGKGQSATNNAKVIHAITGNIVDPASLGSTAHRIPVCAGTAVTAVVTDNSPGTPTNTAGGSLDCTTTPGTCTGAVNVTEKYKSVSQDGKDKDRITFLPK